MDHVTSRCPKCGSERVKIDMRDHPRVRDDDLVTCTNCGSTFTNREFSNLNVQMLRKLLEEAPKRHD